MRHKKYRSRMSGVRKTVKGLFQMQGIAGNSLFPYAKYAFFE